MGLLEPCRILFDRLPHAADAVREQPKLLEDGIMRDGAKLADLGALARVQRIALAARRPASGFIEQIGAIGADEKPVIRIVDQAGLKLFHRGHEFRDRVAILHRVVEVAVRDRFVGHRPFQNASERGECGILALKEQVTVTALEAGFLFERDPASRDEGHQVRRRDIVEPRLEAVGMTAAADRIAVRVEEDHLHVGQFALGDQPDEPAPSTARSSPKPASDRYSGRHPNSRSARTICR